MKKLFLLLALLLPSQLSAQPEVYLETNSITAARGDTIEIWANFNNNNTQTRTIYLTFHIKERHFH